METNDLFEIGRKPGNLVIVDNQLDNLKEMKKLCEAIGIEETPKLFTCGDEILDFVDITLNNIEIDPNGPPTI